MQTNGPIDGRALEQEAEGRYSPFEFIGVDGETYQLPNPQLMNPDDIRQALNVPDREAGDFELSDWEPLEIGRAVGGEGFQALRKLNGYAQGKIIDMWVDHCELVIDEGKELSPSSATRKRATR